MTGNTSRRSFLKRSALAAGTVSLFGIDASANTLDEVDEDKITRSLVILFQGDSITDGNRGRNADPNHIMGHGYAFSIASRVGDDFASSGHHFFNRGVSGNKVSDLEARWQKDTLDIKPDVLSILVGINDASMMIKQQTIDDKDIDAFENSYRNILAQSKNQKEDTLFVLGLPFVYPVGGVNEHFDAYTATVAKLTERVKKLATEFTAVIVDFPTAFDKAFKKAPVDYWIWDGIHPTVPGHEVMTREWIKKVSGRLKFLRSYKYS